jgi:atypical dual specificity phosphatase
MKPFANEKILLPAFPRTPHLPYKPNMTLGDVVATPEESGAIFTSNVNVEEKLDGASVGISLDGDKLLLRNRDHVLRKGYLKDTPAKLQFRPLWGWCYDHRVSFKALANRGLFSVYGEWLWMQHGMKYDRLPAWFVAYDLYDLDENQFLAPPIARDYLTDAGFTVPRLFHQGDPSGLTYERLAALASSPSGWGNDRVEGIYLKTYDEKFVTGRFKMVRPDFRQGALFDGTLHKNSLSVTRG